MRSRTRTPRADAGAGSPSPPRKSTEQGIRLLHQGRGKFNSGSGTTLPRAPKKAQPHPGSGLSCLPSLEGSLPGSETARGPSLVKLRGTRSEGRRRNRRRPSPKRGSQVQTLREKSSQSRGPTAYEMGKEASPEAGPKASRHRGVVYVGLKHAWVPTHLPLGRFGPKLRKAYVSRSRLTRRRLRRANRSTRKWCSNPTPTQVAVTLDGNF